IETLALIELSERLAPLDNAPPQTVRRLAYDDDIDVARPVLTRSRRLAESDLIALAKTKGQSHLLAISERSELNEALAAVLVVRGDTMVARNVAGNRGANLSETSMAVLADRAERDPTLAEKLVIRSDIPLHIFSRLLARASDIVVRRLLAALPGEAESTVVQVVTRIAGKVAAEAGTPLEYAAALR